MAWSIGGGRERHDHITVTFRIIAEEPVTGDWLPVSENGYRPAEYGTEKEGRAALARFAEDYKCWTYRPYRLRLVVISTAQVTVEEVDTK